MEILVWQMHRSGTASSILRTLCRLRCYRWHVAARFYCVLIFDVCGGVLSRALLLLCVYPADVSCRIISWFSLFQPAVRPYKKLKWWSFPPDPPKRPHPQLFLNLKR